jgi:two-component system, sensor histidine kinase and response regulator
LHNMIRKILLEESGVHPSALPSESLPAEALRKLKILVVEDNAINRQLMLALLQKRCTLLVEAEDGVKALAALEESHFDFDVVFMDVQMPHMDGFETSREIRKREEGTGRHLPIVAMTAHALKEDRDRCLASGMDQYMTKPINRKELFALLDHYASLERGKALPAPSKEKPQPAPETEPQTKTPVMDMASALDRADGDKELLADLLKTFIQNTHQTILEITKRIEKQDLEEITKRAHTLKGAAANLSCERLKMQALDLEKQVQTHASKEKMLETAKNLEIELHLLETFLEKIPVS